MRSVNIMAGLAGAIVTAAVGGRADAAIVYQDLDDCPIPLSGANYEINIDMDGPTDFCFGGTFLGISTICSLWALDPSTARVAAADTPPPPFSGVYDWTYKREAGYSIGAGEPWLDGGITFYWSDFGGSAGYWGLAPWTEGYAGVRFQRQTGTWHHAWLRIGFTSIYNLTLFDLAWETEPEAPIAAGAVPAPATLATACVLARLASRRRR